MKQGMMIIILVGCLLFLGGFDLHHSLVKETTDHKEFDALRLKTGTFTYSNLEGGAQVGKGEITIHDLPDSGKFSFSDTESGKFSQHWEAVTTLQLDPISARLSSGEGAGVLVFDLKYSSGRVAGFKLDRRG